MEKELDKCESSGNEGHVCERLYMYSFQNNEKFMQGWNKVRNVIPVEKFSESLLKAQVFFYSRYYWELDYTDLYKVDCEKSSCILYTYSYINHFHTSIFVKHNKHIYITDTKLNNT